MDRRLPKGWKRVRLGDISQINPRADSLKDVEHVSFVAMADVNESGKLTSQSVVPATKESVFGYTRFRRGDILCAKITPCFENGKGALTDNLETEQGLGSTEFHVIRPLQDVLPELMHAVVQSTQFRRRGELWMTGSAGQRRVPADYIEEYLIELPAFDEQRRIVAILDGCDRQIAQVEQLVRLYESEHRKRAYELTRHIDGRSLELDKLVSRIVRKNSKDSAIPLTISAEMGLIRQSKFFGKRIASEISETYTLIKRGEFAYNKSYSDGYPYGVIKRLDNLNEGILSSLYLCFAISDTRKLDSDYLKSLCDAGWFNRQIHLIAHEGARNHGLLNVTAGDFFQMKIPLPPIKQQRKLAAAMESSALQLEVGRRRLAALKQQKRGLMQKLLTGQWRLTRDLYGMETSRV